MGVRFRYAPGGSLPVLTVSMSAFDGPVVFQVTLAQLDDLVDELVKVQKFIDDAALPSDTGPVVTSVSTS